MDQKITKLLDRDLTISLLSKVIVSNKLARNLVAGQIEKLIYKGVVDEGNPFYSEKARITRFHSARALFRSALNNLNKGFISEEVATKTIKTLTKAAMLLGEGREEAMAKYKEKHGILPPTTVTISPTNKCNLYCKGCYADSSAEGTKTLEWDVLDKIMQELHDEMGIRFFVISGGEPLLYKSNGKTIMDLPRKWKDSYFMFYTNGTLITEDVAKEMAELGNITPAISIEGYEKETDTRRGDGVYSKILKAFENLRNAGVMFGTSVTSTKENADIMLTDDFYKHYFDELGSTYMWMFQYMPIGREFTTDLMVPPEKRFELFKKWKQITHETNWFIADFWNSAVLSSGCIACSTTGGYFYIDWNGNIMPCVFVPYYKDNVHQLFSEGKKIADAFFSDFFVKGREWQDKYLSQDGKMGNLMRPCFYRDHHEEFLKIARESKVSPEDERAKEAMEDEEYHKMIIDFDKQLKEIEDPYWEKEYQK